MVSERSLEVLRVIVQGSQVWPKGAPAIKTQ